MILDIAIGGCALAALVAVWHIATSRTIADRVIGADLVTFSAIALLALAGVRFGRTGTFDLVLVATIVAFLAAVSLGRAMSGGRR